MFLLWLKSAAILQPLDLCTHLKVFFFLAQVVFDWKIIWKSHLLRKGEKKVWKKILYMFLLFAWIIWMICLNHVLTSQKLTRKIMLLSSFDLKSVDFYYH